MDIVVRIIAALLLSAPFTLALAALVYRFWTHQINDDSDIVGRATQKTLKNEVLFALSSIGPLTAIGVIWVSWLTPLQIGFGIAFLSAGIGVLGLLSMFHCMNWMSGQFDVVWTMDAVTGPQSWHVPSLVTLEWSNIIAIKVGLSHVFWLQGPENKRITCSLDHRGYRALLQAVREHRPDLDVPAL